MALAESVRNIEVNVGENWREFAECLTKDPELFFPERGASTRGAKQVCGMCAVRNECLTYAMEHGELGIWGGTTEGERRHLIAKRTA